MNIEKQSCTITLNEVDMRGLRLMADLFLQTSRQELTDKVIKTAAKDADAAGQLAREIQQQL